MKRVGKRGQSVMGMPFAVIFAIILIVVFIVIAFIAVKHFLDIGSCAAVGQFYEALQNKVNDAQNSQLSNSTLEISLPSGVTEVCFANLSATITDNASYEIIQNYAYYDANTFIVPPEKSCNMPYKLINFLNITRITQERNPYCVDVSRGLVLEKEFYDRYVTIR